MSFFSEFKAFAMKGNVIDLAVGVVIGAAFGKIVNSLVEAIIMPLVGILIGGFDFKTRMIKVGEAEVKYGLFIQATVEFLIVAFAIFLVVRTINRLKKPEEAAAPAGPTTEEKLLMEIRDAIKQK
ncbi:large-conductance mechanosensitive channel protein MscL [Chitinophaga sp. SYP-B3965]|uniref:large-conductance mechanosensitive channel protein MscL n=1 Tax=Chitinophaga sp. SYP-B3965 TaxID=2663120 RepID=UPI0012996173|nr:large-conductance mechanosensitive channel protein MscL [Chitinophaga sp. SYP-B3965]MRG49096.1 large-conductance mechanosensitive channel protein MscL [Chitinophaga sp. SYP-B3965]